MQKQFVRLIVLAATVLSSQSAQAGLINGSFEVPHFTGTAANFPGAIPGWQTTDSAFEIWSNGFNGVTSYDGTQHAELNAFINGTLFQDAPGIALGTLVGYQFAHRGRAGLDTMRLTITDLGSDNLPGGTGLAADTVLFTSLYADNNTAWGFYTGSGIIALGNTIRFAYTAVSEASGDPSVGNFLDDADFGVGVGTPEPASIVLLGISIACLRGCEWKRRRGAATSHSRPAPTAAGSEVPPASENEK
jgi:hypothetical protein